MIKLNSFFCKHFDIDLARVGTLERPLKAEGIGLETYNSHTIIIKKDSFTKEFISTYDSSIFKLMVFLDQYRYGDKKLPNLPSGDSRQEYQPSSITPEYDNDTYLQALSTLRDSNVTSYSQLVNLILSSKDLVSAQYIKSTSFGEKLEEWYFGDIHQYDGSKFRLNNEGFWELMHIEKGNGRAIVTFYDVKYVYQYLLSLYLIAL